MKPDAPPPPAPPTPPVEDPAKVAADILEGARVATAVVDGHQVPREVAGVVVKLKHALALAQQDAHEERTKNQALAAELVWLRQELAGKDAEFEQAKVVLRARIKELEHRTAAPAPGESMPARKVVKE